MCNCAKMYTDFVLAVIVLRVYLHNKIRVPAEDNRWISARMKPASFKEGIFSHSCMYSRQHGIHILNVPLCTYFGAKYSMTHEHTTVICMIAQCDISGVAILQVMFHHSRCLFLSFGHKTVVSQACIVLIVFDFFIIENQTTPPSHTYIINFEKYKEGRVLVNY